MGHSARMQTLQSLFFFLSFCIGMKTADPGDSFTIRTESASTISQSTAEKRTSGQTPNNSTNSKAEPVKRKEDSASSIKAKIDKNSGIDEKIQEECRQVLEC